jgi:hypothetical protein
MILQGHHDAGFKAIRLVAREVVKELAYERPLNGITVEITL